MRPTQAFGAVRKSFALASLYARRMAHWVAGPEPTLVGGISIALASRDEKADVREDGELMV